MRVLIIANGNRFSRTFFESIFKKGDYIICADGGYRHLKALCVEPDEVLGDFDSFNREKITCERVRVFPTKKDHTDTEIALMRAEELGAREVILLGCIGTRMDHTLANLFLLKTMAEKGIKACLMDEHNSVYYVTDTFSYSGKVGDTLSIVPLSGTCREVATTGLYYPLKGETLFRASSRGISNELTEETATVTMKSGEALVMITRD